MNRTADFFVYLHTPPNGVGKSDIRGMKIQYSEGIMPTSSLNDTYIPRQRRQKSASTPYIHTPPKGRQLYIPPKSPNPDDFQNGPVNRNRNRTEPGPKPTDTDTRHRFD